MYVHPNEELHLYNTSDVQWTSAVASPPSSWTITAHSHIVDNTEGPSFTLKIDGRRFATASPWHGYTAMCRLVAGTATPGGVAYDVARHGRHFGAFIEDGEITLLRSSNAAHTSFEDVPTGITTTSQMALQVEKASQAQCVVLCYSDESGVHARTTGDEGESWSVATTISAEGIYPAFVLSASGTRYYYWLVDNGDDTYDIEGQIRDALDTVIEATFTVLAGISGTGLAADESVGSDGQHRITLLYTDADELQSIVSYNGKDFS